LKNQDERFVVVHEQRSGILQSQYKSILLDRMTGVQYLWARESMGNGGTGGLTVLVDQDGKPLIYNPPTNQ
jgi:hypothetical protein